MQGENDDVLSCCPSFRSYTSHEVAERADEEFAGDLGFIAEEQYRDDDEEFEFSTVRCPDAEGGDAYTISSDQICGYGQVEERPIHPVFDRDLASDDETLDFENRDVVAPIRVPMKKIFFQDREHDAPSSSTSPSSSEADEPEASSAKMSCGWNMKAADGSPGRCKKSKSTGSSSKHWRFIDLLRRSNSADGKDSVVFLTPVPDSKKKKEYNKGEKTEKAKAKRADNGESFSSAHEIFYVKHRALKEGGKRRTFLPYRKDLVGFFAKDNGFGR